MNTLNPLTNPICEIYAFDFSYLIVIFFSLANKYLLTLLSKYSTGLKVFTMIMYKN